MKVLVAIDSFKGSLSSLEAGNAVKSGIEKLGCEVLVKPIADGGEGSVEALADALKARFMDVIVANPLGEKTPARYALKGELGILEMASASGLPLIEKSRRNPLKTSTYGFGEMIAHAIAHGARKFIIGIGGSATNDAGMGMLRALGFKFKDANGAELAGAGEDLIKLATIDYTSVLPHLKECEFLIACDVDNPLFGENGAAYIYAPQKGADAAMVKQLDAGLINFASVVSKHLGRELWNSPGAGAAGGLGFGFVSFLNATLKPGIDIITEEIGLDRDMKGAELVITGEGRLDFQSSMGKTPCGVAKIAASYGVPVIALAGGISPCAGSCNERGIGAFFCILNEPMSLERAMEKETATQNLARVAEQAVRLFLLGHGAK
ncbi:glycerate kinase [Campylobacter gracilis]|uniref:Glycerate kinase n=1 Tax=Campylobacter gracilis RM3268 TaxID=553220 RepID=C8PL28_9BACT|nr:glycerate kinase [Campylobacter gracilis]AKT93105.1 glycerate kinase [Campylobacter gracilis]EEV16443.1 glycerate kinase [Campylobacter gracilis RM3268]UEB44721.1 glycerate kinase [Campylobacter gracilis]SUW78563.1 glycerate kinase 1 [Campylobacter gracilis]